MISWQILFWISVFLILQTYIFYPFLLHILSLGKKQNSACFNADELPSVSVIMSVHNEEKIIDRKIQSVLSSNYPGDKINIHIGSDASTDKTNDILRRKSSINERIFPYIFEKRSGKPTVINRIVEKVDDEYIIMTDAKAIFHPDAIKNMVKHFKNEGIGAVGCNIHNVNIDRSGVSGPEKTFMSREIVMKYKEGIVWGAAVGLYGAAYAIRKVLFTPVPNGFAVDDFFITLNVLRHKKKAILEVEAVADEDVPNLISEEYRRKVRIATGNFKNLGHFRRELATPWKGASFAYISHKVLRWCGPFIFMLIILSDILLFQVHPFYKFALYATAVTISLSIIDYFLSKIGIHIVFLRFIRHFITMNIALFHGFINHIRGIRKDVWQPTNR